MNSNTHIELFIERVVGLMADRLDERSEASKANQAKIRAWMIAQGHREDPDLKGSHGGDPVEDEKALRVARRVNKNKPSPEKVALTAKRNRERAADYKRFDSYLRLPRQK